MRVALEAEWRNTWLVLEEFLQNWQPPDDELLDLIEAAFLEGQIDGLQLSLASACVTSQAPLEH